MLHKLGILFLCEDCGAAVSENDWGWETDSGEDLCSACVAKWHKEQWAYWKPIYDAEVAAGIHNPKGNDDA